MKSSSQTLLATASAAAMIFAANGAFAEDPSSPRMWVSIEGQYAMFHGDAVDMNYYDVNLSPDNGWAGALRVGGKVNEDWFVEGGIRYTSSGKDSIGYYYNSEAFADADYDEDHLVLDLQVGRDIGIGDGGSVRVFGGLRYASFDGDVNAYAYYYGYSLGISTKHQFDGVGPRVGFDAMIPVADNVRVDFGGAVAALYGKRKIKGNLSYGGYGYSASDTDKGFVPNVEGSVALTYIFAPYASVSAGYRASQYWNVIPELNDSGIDNADRLIHGPFLTLTFTN